MQNKRLLAVKLVNIKPLKIKSGLNAWKMRSSALFTATPQLIFFKLNAESAHKNRTVHWIRCKPKGIIKAFSLCVAEHDPACAMALLGSRAYFWSDIAAVFQKLLRQNVFMREWTRLNWTHHSKHEHSEQQKNDFSSLPKKNRSFLRSEL